MQVKTYRPEIDGLRAISILSVLLFHANFKVFSGGYVGVDIFFVISGYLITRNILADIEAGRFTFSRFYTGRIRRLFPALFFTLALSFIVGVTILSPEDLRDLARVVITSLGAVSNIVFWRDSRDYFLTSVNYLPLLHTWSLSLEEQFYLVCPAVMLFLARLGWRRYFGIVFAIAGVFSLVAGEIWLRRDASAVFYLAPFRVFEFSIGALCISAERWRPISSIVLQAIFLAGLAAIGVAIFLLDKQTPFPGTAALLPCLGAALIIFAGPVPGVGRLLTNRLAVGIGLISYSLYLCHWPIFVFARFVVGEVSSLHGRLSLVVLSVAVATVMYFYVETPFRRSRTTEPVAGFWKLAGSCFALTIFLAAPAALAVRYDGWPQRLDAHRQMLRLEQGYGLSGCVADAGSICAFGYVAGAPGVYLIGDSHMEHLIPAFVSAADELHLRGEAFTAGGCVMLLGLQRIEASGRVNTGCRQFRDQTLARIHGNDVPVVISQRWEIGDLADDDGRPIMLTSRARLMEAWREALQRTIDDLGRERRILIVGAQVVLPCEVERRAVKIGPLSPYEARPPCADLSLTQARMKTAPINAMLKSVQARNPNVRLLLPEHSLCEGGSCVAVSQGVLLFQDSGHLTVAGAKFVGAHDAALLFDFLRRDGAPQTTSGR